MITPYEKLCSGANDIIQIVVTTSCDLFTCSNCTQLLPFRTDYRHMDLSCFERAVISLKDWPGVVGLFGGNPCSHPQFPDLCRILASHIPQPRRGLWSNNLLRHGAVVRDTFYPEGRFNLNAHGDEYVAGMMEFWVPNRIIPSSRRTPAWHSPILLNYRDFGITEEDWIARREACDINQRWSAAIVQRDLKPYAYFCEVAAALDGIRGENHGTPVHYGWWQAPMAQFQSQVHGCCDQGCGIPLKAKGSIDADQTYDISESFIPLTRISRSNAITTHPNSPDDLNRLSRPTDYMRVRV